MPNHGGNTVGCLVANGSERRLGDALSVRKLSTVAYTAAMRATSICGVFRNEVPAAEACLAKACMPRSLLSFSLWRYKAGCKRVSLRLGAW